MLSGSEPGCCSHKNTTPEPRRTNKQAQTAVMLLTFDTYITLQAALRPRPSACAVLSAALRRPRKWDGNRSLQCALPESCCSAGCSAASHECTCYCDSVSSPAPLRALSRHRRGRRSFVWRRRGPRHRSSTASPIRRRSCRRPWAAPPQCLPVRRPCLPRASRACPTGGARPRSTRERAACLCSRWRPLRRSSLPAGARAGRTCTRSPQRRAA